LSNTAYVLRVSSDSNFGTRDAATYSFMTAEEIIAQVKDLPMVSETARKLAVQLNEPESYQDDIIETLRCDNILTAKLLRVCNSAASGVSEPVMSVEQALFLLGYNMVFRIVCAISFSGALTDPTYDIEANGLWTHSLNTATAAEFLADVECYGNFLPSTAFTAGLLHDIGKSVIGKVLTPKARVDIRVKMTAESISRVEAEKAILGADHCEVGACLLKRWSLPDLIVDAVAGHHAPVLQPSIQLSALVYLANTAVHLCGSSPASQEHDAQTKNTAAAVLGIPVERIDKIVEGVDGAMQGLPQMMLVAA
jgi:putative nucleotidyltransferase with HDIG domain